jgi:hypothetical protein
MSRKAPPEIDEELVAALEADDTDQHGFWDGPTLDLEALDLAFAVDDEAEGAPDGARETLVYMGSVPQTQVDDQELTALADWAESKACRACRTNRSEPGDAPPLEHEGCRQALRASTLLRSYS